MAILHTAAKKMPSSIFKYRRLILVVVFLFLPLSFVGATNYGSGTYNSGYYSSTIPGVPVASPVAGVYGTTQSVSLSAASSTSIKYATDVMPTDCSSGTTYTVAISVSTSTTIYARACNSYGNSATSTFAYVIDTVNPIISLIYSDTTPTISWTTSKLASSIIDYGLTNSYGTSTPETNISPRVTSHSVTISNLSSCTTYHYRIRSRDAAANEGVSPDQTFTTSGCTASSNQTETTSGQIDRTSGGTLTTSDSALSISVPINFATSNANFQIHQLDKPTVIAQTSIPSGYLSAGSDLYELKSLSNNTTVISSFANPLTITMSYTTSDIVGLDESTLKIYRWDNSTWNQLTNCSVNTSANTITCNTNNFSVFGIFGRAASASNGGGGGMPSSWNNKPIVPTGGFKITVSGNTLSFNAGSDVKKMAVSLDSNFSSTNLEDYVPTKQINLCSSSCTVYIKFYTEYGVASDVVSQEITINQSGLSNVPPVESEIVFKDLKLGDQDIRVKVLQQFLNQNGYKIADSGVGSLGHETDYFGSLTVIALTKFQIANNLTSEKGYLGKVTQAFIDSFIKSKVAKPTLISKLAGQILLQVESHGEAWYVNPKDNKRYYLGRPDDAFNLMKTLSLGISEKEFASWSNLAPTWAKGRLYLRPQSHGEAYYVDLNRHIHYLGRPMDAWLLLRSQGLGITNKDLAKVVIAE